jgi:hypothetical protein
MCFHIYAFNSAGHSAWTPYACTTTPTVPTAPSGLTVTAISSSAIRLNWSDNSNNETGFEMDNGTSDLGPVPTNTTTWTKTGLAPNTYMCFHVYAFNLAGNSAWTPYSCITSLSFAPPRGGLIAAVAAGDQAPDSCLATRRRPRRRPGSNDDD